MPRMMTQPERIEYMLESLGMKAAQFAKECHLTEATVSRWRSNACKISQSCADQIEDRFPQFSTSWILGTTRFLNDPAGAFSKSLYRTHQNFDLARELLARGGYSVETPFDRSSTTTDASIAFLDMANGQMSVTVTRNDDGASCEVYLSALDAWVSDVIASAAEAFAPVFESSKDGTAQKPKPAQWVHVDPSSLRKGVSIGKKRQKAETE